MFDKLDDLLVRFEELLNELGEPGVTDDPAHFQKLMKEQSDLQPIVDAYKEYKKNKETIEDSLSMLESEKDEEMREMLKEELIRRGIEPNHIISRIYTAMDIPANISAKEMYDELLAEMQGKGRCYLFLDEIQEVNGWEKAVNSLLENTDCDIYVTGSNAYLLSTEFSTLLSGRYVEIRMLPLSFKEFLTFYSFDQSVTLEEKFQKYLQFGGMPILREYQFNEARSNQALEGIYSTVVLRDILQRNEGADQAMLQKIMLFLCSNIGSINSPSSIGNVLYNEGDIKGRNVAGKTVEKYISMLHSAYIFFSVGRYDVKGKQLLKTLGKNYIIDMGFRNMLLGYRDADRGHILENIVYLELLRRDYRVYIGKVGDTEVDFVAEKPEDKVYIQVTESMLSPETRERELRPLQMISDNYEKIVLSMDWDFIRSYNGIKSLNLLDWLLNEK